MRVATEGDVQRGTRSITKLVTGPPVLDSTEIDRLGRALAAAFPAH